MQSPQAPHSSTSTPTSSVRPSLDLPANARSSSPAPNTTAQRRNRAALRDYYNLKAKNPAPANTTAQAQPLSRSASIASTTSTTTTAPDPHSSSQDPSSLTAALDDPSFQPEPYIQSLLASSNLKTVLKVEATLISEIKNLDGERKALVYDNYSKLIKATRTIGGMRRSVDGETNSPGRVLRGRQDSNYGGGLSSKGMDALRDSVGDVARMAEELSVNGKDIGSAEIERRKSERAERDRRETVTWVLKGQERLRKMVENGKVDEAQAEWKTISGLLEKWEGVEGVRETKMACEEALHDESGEQNGTG